ncbi:MAG: VOC family protein [Thermomicrobiales bacterium]
MTDNRLDRPNLNQLDAIVPDVPAATAFLTAILGVEPVYAEERFAEFRLGAMTLMLSPDAMVPMANAAGVILHFEVADVDAALDRARDAGATVLRETAPTDWGWESAMIAGPEGLVIDFYRMLSVGTG